MKKMLLIVFGIFSFFSINSYATSKDITVRVTADKSITSKMRVTAIGFEVGGKKKGGLGSGTTKTGPAGGSYSFGIRTKNGDVSCGTAVLKNNATVVLYMKGNSCFNKTFVAKTQ